MDKSAFYTRKSNNEPKKVDLFLPDGSESGHFLMVLGSLSDKFRESNAEAMRSVVTQDLSKDQVEDVKNEALAVLVTSWSFDEECTVENVKEFLKEAPQIKDKINNFAGSQANFIAKKQKRSTSTRKTTSTQNPLLMD